MNVTRGFLILATLAIVSGCATMPTGPSVAALPGPGKPFEEFQADDYACRQWAQGQIGGASPSQTANQDLATGAAVGTLAGAGLGALIGSASGHAGAGAATGAEAGLLTGTAVASGPASYSEYELQRRYDIAYQQCMYAKGNQISGARPVRTYGPPPPGPNPGPALPPPSP
jgi:outer membrane lipoprotein SlyB